MYAVAFDLVVADTERHHPKGVSQAYADIASILNEYGFRRVQGTCMLQIMKIWPSCLSLCKP